MLEHQQEVWAGLNVLAGRGKATVIINYQNIKDFADGLSSSARQSAHPVSFYKDEEKVLQDIMSLLKQLETVSTYLDVQASKLEEYVDSAFPDKKSSSAIEKLVKELSKKASNWSYSGSYISGMQQAVKPLLGKYNMHVDDDILSIIEGFLKGLQELVTYRRGLSDILSIAAKRFG